LTVPVSDNAPPPQANCTLCGMPHAREELSEWNGGLVCAACRRGRRAASDKGRPANAHIVTPVDPELPGNLLWQITCPHCWAAFGPESVQGSPSSEKRSVLRDPDINGRRGQRQRANQLWWIPRRV